MTRKDAKIVDSPLTREEAEWMRGVDELTARRMVEWLKAGTDVRRPIDTLNKAQLSALAEIARSTYIGEVAVRRAELKDAPDCAIEHWQLWLI